MGPVSGVEPFKCQVSSFKCLHTKCDFPLFRKFRGIAKQINQHLAEFDLIGTDIARYIRRTLKQERYLLLFGTKTE